MSLEVGNKNIVLIVGKPSTGKSAALRNLTNQDRIAYMNTDLKEIPFKSGMQEVTVTDPYDILSGIDEIESSEDFDMAILDTLSFAMSQFEVQYVLDSGNTQKALNTYSAA